MIKKLTALLLSGVLTLGLAACGSGTRSEVGSADTPAETESAEVTITAGTVLLDWEGLKVTARELTEDSIWGTELGILVENNSDRNLGVSCDDLVVNNYMIDELFSASVAAGKKANETITISDTDLEQAGISTISDIAIRFHVYDSDSYETLYRADEVVLQTSAYGTVEQLPADDGEQLLNQDGIRIVARYVEEDTILGADLQLFMENSSGKDINVSCDDVSVNGFMVETIFSCAVNDGRMALDEITLLGSDLEKNGIEKIETVELTIRITDPETYDTILETEPVSITVSA